MTAGVAREEQVGIFSQGPYRFPDNPLLDSMARQLHATLDFRRLSSHIIPSKESTYDVGNEDSPTRQVACRSLSVHGTQTLRNGVMQVREKGVIEFATNSSMVIIPVYTDGNSPFDLWHPASGYMRDGAIWLVKGSPNEHMMRAAGVDRMLGAWDTTTSTYEGSTLWYRYEDTTVRPYHRQYDDHRTINVDIGGDYSITSAALTTSSGGTWATSLVGEGLLGGAMVGRGLLRAKIGSTAGGTVTSTLFWAENDGNGYFAGNLTVDGNLLVGAGSPWFDVTHPDYGAAGDGVTNDHAAIQAAITAATNAASGPPYGGVVYFPRGEYLVDEPLVVGNRVRLVGADEFASRITADPTFTMAASTTTAVVILGPIGGGNVFHSRVENLGIDCGDVAGITGVYTRHAQELCGCFNVHIFSYTNYGIHYDNTGGSSASECGVAGFNLAGSDSGSLAGVYFSGVAGGAYIKHGTVNWRTTGTHTDGILVNGGDTTIKDIHVERHIDGIHCTNGAVGVIEQVYGHSSVDNLIRLASGTQVQLLDINKGSGATGNLLVDENHGGLSYTYASTGYLPIYSAHEVHIGPAAVLGNQQTALVDLTIPDVAGTNQNFVLTEVGQTISNKLLTDPVIRASGQTTAQDLWMSADNQEVATNTVSIPNLGDNGAGGGIERKFLIDTRVSGSDILWQETRSLRLVDCQVKRNGQSSPFVALSSSDQSAATCTVNVPDLGTAGTYTIDFLEATQTVTAPKNFSLFAVDTPEAVEIAGGLATISTSYTIVDGESSADDQLDQIIGGRDGMLMILAVASGVTVTVNHNSASGSDGNIFMKGDANLDVNNTRRRLMFVRHNNGAQYEWHEIGS